MRSPRALAALLIALPLVLSGCSEAEGRVDLQDPTDLGAFAARIDQEPERTDELLAEAGVTREELHEAILRVAADPQASRAYRDAFEAAWEDGEEGDTRPAGG